MSFQRPIESVLKAFAIGDSWPLADLRDLIGVGGVENWFSMGLCRLILVHIQIDKQSIRHETTYV